MLHQCVLTWLTVPSAPALGVEAPSLGLRVSSGTAVLHLLLRSSARLTGSWPLRTWCTQHSDAHCVPSEPLLCVGSVLCGVGCSAAVLQVMLVKLTRQWRLQTWVSPPCSKEAARQSAAHTAHQYSAHSSPICSALAVSHIPQWPQFERRLVHCRAPRLQAGTPCTGERVPLLREAHERSAPLD